MSEDRHTSEDTQEQWTPWQWFKCAIGCYLGALVSFLLLYGLEVTNAGGLMPAWVALLYMIGGKWLVAGVCAFFGTAGLILGIRELGRRRRDDRKVTGG